MPELFAQDCSFDADWRRQQEIRMRPYADIIYQSVWGNNIVIQRCDGDSSDTAILDRCLGIDVQIRFPCGMVLLGQEKFLSNRYRHWSSVTVEYEQNQWTHEPGNWYKLACQFYMVVYINDLENGFDPWIILDWTKVVIETHVGRIGWHLKYNNHDGARASFRYAHFSAFPPSCVIAKGP